jgi:hypothetical protein
VLIDSAPDRALKVLSGRDDPLDVPPLRARLAGEQLDRDDPLAFLAGDLRPVVGVRRIGQVLNSLSGIVTVRSSGNS